MKEEIYKRYNNYVMDFPDYHQCEGDYPVTFDEWYDNEYQEEEQKKEDLTNSRNFKQALKSNGHLRLSLLLGKISREKVEAAMGKALSSREAKIIEMRFPSQFGNDKATFKQIGKEFSITVERVRQIESYALEKLRNYLKFNH